MSRDNIVSDAKKGHMIHALPTPIGQHIVAITFGYERKHHHMLGFDPVLAVVPIS